MRVGGPVKKQSITEAVSCFQPHIQIDESLPFALIYLLVVLIPHGGLKKTTMKNSFNYIKPIFFLLSTHLF